MVLVPGEFAAFAGAVFCLDTLIISESRAWVKKKVYVGRHITPIFPV